MITAIIKQYNENRWNLPFDIIVNNHLMTKYPEMNAEKKPIISGKKSI